jgi:hypothetical protein
MRPIAQSDLPAATQARTSLSRAVTRTGPIGRLSPRRINDLDSPVDNVM